MEKEKQKFTFNTAKLRGRIVELYETVLNFSEYTSRKRQFVMNVLNGKAILSHADMDEWIMLLKIPANEIDAYFFNHDVHKREQE